MWTCIEGGYSKQLLHTHIQRSMYITSTGPASAPCQNTWATADIYCTRTSSTACTLQSRDLHLEGYSGHPLYRYSLHYIHYTVTGPAPCQKIWATADIHCTRASSIVYIYIYICSGTASIAYMYNTVMGPASAPCQKTWATADIYGTRTSSIVCILVTGPASRALQRTSIVHLHPTLHVH